MQPELEPADTRRPWWADLRVWLMIAVVVSVVGMVLAPRLFGFGFGFLFLPLFWFRRSGPRR